MAMWSDVTHEPAMGKDRSSIACQSCRRRKVKCDRELPQCRVCEQTSQACEYPERALKPGPKIGSTQRQKKRYRWRESQTRSRKDEISWSGSTLGSGSDVRHYFSGELNEQHMHLDTDGSVFDDENSDRRHGETSAAVSGDQGELTQRSWNQERRNSRLNMHDLSFILHPAHEASSPDKPDKGPEVIVASTSEETASREKQSRIQQACYTIGLSHTTLEHMIQIYFKNMVAINLFHEPSFSEKLSKIDSPVQISALLAALVGFAARFHSSETAPSSPDSMPQAVPDAENGMAPPEYYQDLALKLVDEAVASCGDDAPPLCVVQALIVATHSQLTRGVHGRAWRSLGMCVRLAYELNLHLVDAVEPSSPRSDEEDEEVESGRGNDGKRWWRDKEEKRRAWWAIWEMDVFASTIRRTPTAINWDQMEILLPADDSDWFADDPAPSVFMDRDPLRRWKALQESGNGSPKAWFLVINSLMKDAQVISSPRGVLLREHEERVPPSQRVGDSRRGKPCRPGSGSTVVEEARQKLELLANAVQCFVLALPAHLKYRNQYLSFDGATAASASVPGRTESLRQFHCGIYNIFTMTQLARLMIYRYDLFGGGHHASAFNDPDNPAVRQYFDAADNIFALVSHSYEDHIRHMNPFLASTIWLAAAVQLVRQYVRPPKTEPCLTQSRFDVLYLTYKRCTIFWETQTALGQNLETLEKQLQDHCHHEQVEQAKHTERPGRGVKQPYPRRNKPGSTSVGRNNLPASDSIQSNSNFHQRRPSQYLPEPAHNNDGVTVQDSARDYSYLPMHESPLSHQPHTDDPSTTTPAIDPCINFITLPGRTAESGDMLHLESFSTSLSPTLVVSPLVDNASPSFVAPIDNVEWQNIELPMDLQALLSGMSSY